MNSVLRLIEILVSWPAITFWLCLVFRHDLSRLFLRIQSIRVPSIEGTFKTSDKKE
jgi:hypothetical protein